MAVDQGSFWPVRSSRAVILAATVAWSLPHAAFGQADEIFKDGFDPVTALVINEVDYDFTGVPTPGSANLP